MRARSGTARVNKTKTPASINAIARALILGLILGEVATD